MLPFNSPGSLYVLGCRGKLVRGNYLLVCGKGAFTIESGPLIAIDLVQQEPLGLGKRIYGGISTGISHGDYKKGYGKCQYGGCD